MEASVLFCDRRQFTEVYFGLGHGLDVGLEVIGEGDVVEKDVRVSMPVIECLLQQPHRLAHLVQVLVLQENHKRGIHMVFCHIHFRSRLVIDGRIVGGETGRIRRRI